MRDLAFAKTCSWAIVSFFVLLGIDLVTHLALYGTPGFTRFASTAALGTFLGCVGKSPVYLIHERFWDRVGVGVVWGRFLSRCQSEES